jgi:tetratricopeptide (TPR) repeat protein
MALAAEESRKSDSKASRPRLSWGLRFIIAATGAAVSFWLASRQNVHNLPALPTFRDRLMQAAPTLLEGALGLFFLIWAGLLFREAEARSTPKLITSTTAAEAAKKKSWTAVKWVLFAAFILATIPSLGGNYFKYLWPGYPDWISHAARPVFDMLALFGVFVESYNRRKKQSPQPGTGFGGERVPWLDERQKTFILVTLVGVAVIFGVFHFARKLPPSSAKQLIVISVLALAAIQVTVLRAHRKSEQNESRSDIQARSLVADDTRPGRRKWKQTAAVWGLIAIFVTVMHSHLPSHVKTVVFVALLVILVIGAVALAKLKMWIFGLSKQGEFDRAIQMDRRFSRIPGYGSPLEGVIYFNAGRYAEAREYVKPSAFDQQGEPRLTSMELYTYALALENDGMQAEAQKLLEAAVQVPQKTAGFHVALATCLLDQKKDAERARELLELAMAHPGTQSSGYGQLSDHLMRLGRYAWALAACGRREEAEAQLKKAFAGSTGLKDRDLAGLHYFAGEAWRSMGEWKKARAAFDEALRLSPDGPAATGTQKALAKMRVEAQD